LIALHALQAHEIENHSRNRQFLLTDSPNSGKVIEKINCVDSHPSSTGFTMRQSDLNNTLKNDNLEHI
jgi:hypothetical protein